MVVAAFLSATTDVYVFGNLGRTILECGVGNVPGRSRIERGLCGPGTIPRALWSLALEIGFHRGGEWLQPLPQKPVHLNSGSDSLHWQASPNVPWITVTPSEGIDPSTLRVYVNLSGMEPGTIAGRLR